MKWRNVGAGYRDSSFCRYRPCATAPNRRPAMTPEHRLGRLLARALRPKRSRARRCPPVLRLHLRRPKSKADCSKEIQERSATCLKAGAPKSDLNTGWFTTASFHRPGELAQSSLTLDSRLRRCSPSKGRANAMRNRMLGCRRRQERTVAACHSAHRGQAEPWFAATWTLP